jgi:hypothetical protein
MTHLAVLALLLQVGQPRWAALQDVRLGGPVDDILAKGGECRPTHHSPTLDTWTSPRYRSYLMVPYRPPAYVPPWARAAQLIMLDIAACTAFERRTHRAGAAGEVGEC